MPKLEWQGIGELRDKLRSNMELELAKKIVKVNGDELNRRMQKKTLDQFTKRDKDGKRISTGQTRRSITTTLSDGGLTVTVKPTTDYASYPEYGTRFMEATPYVRPSHNVQKELFKHDMSKLV